MLGQAMHGDVFLLVEPAGRRWCVVERRELAVQQTIFWKARAVGIAISNGDRGGPRNEGDIANASDMVGGGAGIQGPRALVPTDDDDDGDGDDARWRQGALLSNALDSLPLWECSLDATAMVLHRSVVHVPFGQGKTRARGGAQAGRVHCSARCTAHWSVPSISSWPRASTAFAAPLAAVLECLKTEPHGTACG